MDTEILIFAFAAAFLGSAIATWTGFGAATILTPVIAAFLEIRQTVLVVAIYHGIHNLVKVVTFRRGVVWRVAALFGIGAVIFSLIGGLLSSIAPASWLKLILGVFLILDGVFGFLEGPRDRQNAPGAVRAITGGAVSGFAAGIIGTGGAVRALFLHRFLHGKEDYVATSALIALVIDVSRVPIYLTQYPTAVTGHLAPITLTTVAAGFLGVIFARRFLQSVSITRFRRVLLVALVVSGGLFIAQGLRN